MTEDTAPLRRADALIYEDVWECLYQAAEVDASEIQVLVVEGYVKLQGFINSRLGRRIAASAPLGSISALDDDWYEAKLARGLINNHTGLN